MRAQSQSARRHLNDSQTEHLRRLREVLGETTFQRIQRDVWKQFSPRPVPTDSNGTLAPLALYGIWDELLHALQEAAKRQAIEQQSSSRMQRTGGVLWELVKNGVPWSATLNFRREHLGWEVVITHKDQRSHTRQFSSREKAEAWADKECVEIAMGWKE